MGLGRGSGDDQGKSALVPWASKPWWNQSLWRSGQHVHGWSSEPRGEGSDGGVLNSEEEP